MKSPTLRWKVFLSFLVISATGVAGAGVYDDPQNLKVLPKQVSASDLRKTMRGFSLGVGARCDDCHASKPGQTWEQFDYPSDEKPMKEVARQMMRMMDEINGRYLAKLDPADHERVRVACVTCHRGQRLPRQITEVLDEAMAKGNVAAAIEKYGQLKKEYYGSHSYDFTELTLTQYARELAGRGRTADALGIAHLAASEYPASFMPHYLLGEFHLAQGDRSAARGELEKAFQLAPDQAWIKEKLDGLAEK